MREDIDKPLLLSDDVVFTCQNSGACCRNDWLVGVDARSHERVKDVPWERYDPALGGGEKFTKLPLPLRTGETLTFARKPCGACVFLTPDVRCAIHLHRGYRDKPQVCKEFPYSFTETPDGIAVGVSFACTAVRGHRGRPLGEQTEEIRHVLAGSNRVRKLPEPITLYGRTDIAWDDYRRIEEAMLEVFAEPASPFPTALVAGSVLLAAAVGLRQREDAARRAERPARETLWGGLDELRRDGYRKVFAIAANVRYPARASHAYLAPLYTWLQFSRTGMSRVRLVATLYANVLKFRRGRGVLRDAVTGGRAPVEIAAVHGVELDRTPEVDRLLRTYWTHVLFRKTLTPTHGVFRGYQTMLALYGFMKWAAKLRAHQDGRARTTAGDVEEAVRLVEQRFVLHAQFADVYSLSPVLTLLADRLYRLPTFVRSAVLEPPRR